MIDLIIVARQRAVLNVYDNLAEHCAEADIQRHMNSYRLMDTDFARAIVLHHEAVEKLLAAERRVV